jgi:hypothetical protein
MIKPYVMTREQVKQFLQIPVATITYDDQIDLFLPLVSDDLTRTNGICNQTFIFEGTADTDGTVVLSNVVLSSALWDCIYIGSVVLINDEDGVIASYDKEAKTITLESALTKTATEETLLIRNFPSGSKVAVSQMVWYKLDDSTINTDFGREAKSKGIGPVSVSFSDGSKNQGASIDSRFGYPSSLMAGLSTIRRKRFF